ncbi:MAG: DUF1820 family protein [Pseudomonadota bacterium]
MYKVVFFNQGKVYELFCKSVDSSSLYGFIELAELVFDTDRSVVVDPTEERMREEFGQTERLILPIQSVMRVEKVQRRGNCVIRDRDSGEKVTQFPLSGPKKRV